MESKVRMVHCVFGTEMLVPESKVERYLAAGHRLLGGPERHSACGIAAEERLEQQESGRYAREEQEEGWEYEEGLSIDPFADQEEPEPAPVKKALEKKQTKKPASKKSAAKKPVKKGSKK